jgi:hypothetical protein
MKLSLHLRDRHLANLRSWAGARTSARTHARLNHSTVEAKIAVIAEANQRAQAQAVVAEIVRTGFVRRI